MRNHITVVQILLAAGARQADFNMTTSLHTASARAHIQVMMLLLEHGASKDGKDCNGETPRDWAVNANQETSKDILRGRTTAAAKTDEDKVEGVWHSNVSYLSGFAMRKRSGLESSYVISVRQ
jgi:ankyrin repeat protein